jgi:hypothetical protein
MKAPLRAAVAVTLLAACAHQTMSIDLPDASTGGRDASTGGPDASTDAPAEDASLDGAVCGHLNEVCCDGVSCLSGFTCAPGGHCEMDGGSCGSCGNPCCTGQCLTGMACEQGVCTVDGGCPDPNCGALGQPCCGGTVCHDGNVCFESECEPADAVPADAGTD